MIKYYYRSKNSSTKQLDKFKTGCWINVVDPSQDEIEELATSLSLDEGLFIDATDEDEMPRMAREDGVVYLFLRFAYTNDQLQIETAPILFILSEKFLITVSRQKFLRLEKFTNDTIDYTSLKPTRLMLQILDQVDDEYESKLSGISRQIKTIRSRLRIEDIKNKDFIDFVLIEDVLNDFMSALTPMNSILKRMLLGKNLKLVGDNEDIVEDLMLNNEQSIEACKSTLKTIVNIRESYSTIMTNNLNRVIRLLTVLTVIISVPTLIASLYGMNVALPFEGSAKAFAGIMVISLLISLLLLIYFKVRKWL